MNEMEWEELVMSSHKSQSYKKIKNYVKEVTRQEAFKKDVEKIRKDFSIEVRNKPSEEYESYTLEMTDRKAFYKELRKIMDKYKLHRSYWIDSIEHYIFYNKFQEFANNLQQGLVFAEDAKNMIEDYNAEVYDNLKEEREIFEETYYDGLLCEDNEHYPIGLRISPWATKRDILDYVKNNYSNFIEKIQKRYQIGTNIATLKTKSEFIQERNDFIWENRELPRKEIMSLLYKKYKDKKDFDIDEANISKIISLRKKKNSGSE